MSEQMDAGGEADFKPGVSQMQPAMLIIGFVGYALLGWIWGGSDYYNTFFAWGGWLWLIFLFILLYGAKIVENRSPKFVSNVIGTTISQPDPVIAVEAQGGYPRMGLYPLRTVRGLGIYEFSMTCRAYAWCPVALAYKIGQEEKGVNVFGNANFVRLREHSELAPHLLSAMRMMRRPAYNPEMTLYMAYYPLMVNSPTAEQIATYKKRFMDLGVDQQTFDVHVRQMLEQYACDLSMFRYKESLDKPEQMYQSIIKSQNAMIDTLKKDNRFFKSEISALHDLTRFARDIPKESSWRDRLPIPSNQQESEREEQDNRGGRR